MSDLELCISCLKMVPVGTLTFRKEVGMRICARCERDLNDDLREIAQDFRDGKWD